MKICTKCKQERPLTDYYKSAKNKDGLHSWCRECLRVFRVYKPRAKKHYTREQMATWPSRKKKYAKKKRQYVSSPQKVQRYRQRRREYDSEYKRKYPERKKAKAKVQQAIETGLIFPVGTQTCKTCNAQAREYHHPDYNKPLEVIPMCLPCHRKWHRENRPIEVK